MAQWTTKFACGGALLLAISGCGGSSSTGENCGAAAPCGGDPVGTWIPSATCVQFDTSALGFPAACTPGNMTFDATYSSDAAQTFNANLTYSSTGTMTGEIGMSLPASCLTGGRTCVVFTNALNNAGLAGTCSNAPDGGCSCSLTKTVSMVDSGTYTVSGSNMTQISATSGTSTGGFCVQGNDLTEFAPTGSGMTGTLVFTKQL
jgi:hypothetical protein